MNYPMRARVLALALCLGLCGTSAAQMSVECSGLLTFNNMLPGRLATHSLSCYAAGLPGTIISSSLQVYLTALPQAGSNTIPAGAFAVSPNNSSFTAFTGVGLGNAITVWTGGTPPGSSNPQNIYVQVTAPGNQPQGQYTGSMTVEMDVTYTP